MIIISSIISKISDLGMLYEITRAIERDRERHMEKESMRRGRGKGKGDRQL